MTVHFSGHLGLPRFHPHAALLLVVWVGCVLWCPSLVLLASRLPFPGSRSSHPGSRLRSSGSPALGFPFSLGSSCFVWELTFCYAAASRWFVAPRSTVWARGFCSNSVSVEHPRIRSRPHCLSLVFGNKCWFGFSRVSPPSLRLFVFSFLVAHVS